MSPTKIEWSDETWNPVTGCTKVSPGCAHCYIERSPPFRIAHRTFERPYDESTGTLADFTTTGLRFYPERLSQPIRWKRPRRIFVNSLSDLFHEAISDQFIDGVFASMALAPQHIFQVLTKRPQRMREYIGEREDRSIDVMDHVSTHFASDWLEDWCEEHEVADFTPDWPLPNVWLGVTAENQRWADERIPLLLDTPAAVRFVSYEPALGPLDITRFTDPWRGTEQSSWTGIDWLIVGGESGPKHRPFDLAWARQVVDDCKDHGVACFVKQLGGFRPGTALEDLPEDLRVREYPR